MQSEPYLEGSQSAKLEKCLNIPPCMAVLIGSWAPGLNWQLWYQLELVTSPSPDKDRSGRGAKARQMQDIWKAALGPGLSSSLPLPEVYIRTQNVCCLDAKCSLGRKLGQKELFILFQITYSFTKQQTLKLQSL